MIIDPKRTPSEAHDTLFDEEFVGTSDPQISRPNVAPLALPAKTSTKLTNKQRQQMRLTELQEAFEYRGSLMGDIAYTSPIWARFTLPYRDPGDLPRWVIKNHTHSLIVTPGTRPDGNGGQVSAGYPYGMVPRALMIYLATEAKRTKSPMIEVGDSRWGFLKRIGLSTNLNSASKQRLDRGLIALSSCSIVLQETISNADGTWGYEQIKSDPIKAMSLWFDSPTRSGKERESLLQSEILLTPDYYDSIIDRAMPLYLDDIRLLRRKPIAIDIYLWLTYRLHVLKKPTKVTWQQLSGQFGGSRYKYQRAFRRDIRDAISLVLSIYTDAKISAPQDTDYVTLYPSKPRVSYHELN